MKLKDLIKDLKTDKNTSHSYADSYDELFTPLRESAMNILEIGVNDGGSIKLWHKYFPNATIHGADINIYNKKNEAVNEIFELDRVKLYEGNAYSQDFIDRNFENIKFDIIIDDGSHKARHMEYFVKNYRKILKPGGIMVVEDVKHVFRKRRRNFLKACLPEDLRTNAYFIDLRHQRGRSKRPNNILFVYSEN